MDSRGQEVSRSVARRVGLFSIGVVVGAIACIYLVYLTALILPGSEGGSSLRLAMFWGLRLAEFIGLTLLYVFRGNPFYGGMATAWAFIAIAVGSRL